MASENTLLLMTALVSSALSFSSGLHHQILIDMVAQIEPNSHCDIVLVDFSSSDIKVAIQASPRPILSFIDAHYAWVAVEVGCHYIFVNGYQSYRMLLDNWTRKLDVLSQIIIFGTGTEQSLEMNVPIRFLDGSTNGMLWVISVIQQVLYFFLLFDYFRLC